MTQIGKECHSHCEIFKRMGECIMPTQGVFARVLEPGEIHVGGRDGNPAPHRAPALQAAVITLSDKGARGERRDESGPPSQSASRRQAMRWWSSCSWRTRPPP